MEQTIRINLRGVINARLTDLHPFQEDMKVLEEENYQKLKNNILEDGFSFAPHVFTAEDGSLWILDGHQRYACLKRMEEEGYPVPTIPCMEVDAENLEHARRLVLEAASQFGTFKVTKVVDFVKKAGLEINAAVSRFALPAVKLEKFTDVAAHNRKLPDGATEVDPEKFSAFAHTCPKCGFGFDDAK